MKSLKNKEILIIIISYVVLTINLKIKDINLYKNIVNPIFWVSILIYSIWNVKKYYIRFYRSKMHLVYITIIGILQLIIYIYTGFIFGFAKNPYSNQITDILKNIILQLIQIISIEAIRAILIIRNKNNKMCISFITFVLILSEINYNTLIGLYPHKKQIFEYICQSIIPLISCNILYSFLALNTSLYISVIYRIFTELMVYVLPILPNINWFVYGSMYVISPIFVYAFFKNKFTKERKDIKKQSKNNFPLASYIIAIILAIIIVCFMLGLFKYEPIAILSNSMIPIFTKGDVVIFKKLTEEELKQIPKDAIIIYTIEGQNIAHRIVNIIKENDNVVYQTKGDSNNIADTKLVHIQQIKGVYVFHIKYIGFPSVLLYEYFNNDESKV